MTSPRMKTASQPGLVGEDRILSLVAGDWFFEHAPFTGSCSSGCRKSRFEDSRSTH